MLPIFVRYSCGCVGLAPHENTLAWIIQPCDNEPHESRVYNLFIRDQEKKSYVYLKKEESNKILKDFSSLVADGYDLRNIKAILK